jgi:hypothetical protein
MDSDANSPYKKSMLQKETWISICASITAVAALLDSVFETYENHKHNRLSLKPLLFISDEISKDNYIREVAIDNFGTGPARIMDFKLLVDGKPVTVNGGQAAWDTAEHLLGIDKLNLHYEINELDSDSAVMRVDEHLRIIGVDEADYDRLPPQLRSEWNRALKRLSIVVTFSSVYDEISTVRYPKIK